MLGPFLALLGLPQQHQDEDEDNPGRPTPPGAQARSQEQQAESRRHQIERLAAYLHSAKVRPGTAKKIVESVRQVSEVVIWSDRHNTELLSLTVEVGLHQAMLGLLLLGRSAQQRSQAEGAVAVQILQTFSIILDSVTDTKFIYALLSNNFVNQLIAAPVDLENEEVLSYYIAFLKALSLRLTPSTIHFFFNELMDDFPLYTTAIAHFDHPDSMVRVAVRAITLNVFRINDPDALEFILNAPACAHFWEQVVCTLRGTYDDAFRILVEILGGGSPTAPKATTAVDSRTMTDVQGWAALDQVLEMHMGLLAYLSDILNLGVDRINQRVTDEFRDRILARTYVHAIEVGWRSGASFEETLFMQVVTLFLAHFFSIVRYSPLLVDTIVALFYVPGRSEPGDPSDDDNDDDDKPRARLVHPFVPSPFESSRTLAPWLCVVLEILRNKAISPTTLVKSVLTPRRMLRTRALLESLTGSVSVDDCCSSMSNQSALTMSPAFIGTPQPLPPPPPAEPVAGVAGAAAPRVAPVDHQSLLPSSTQSIATTMVHVLADTPPAHSWVTIDLAALVLVQLTRSARGQLILDPGLSAEVALAQRSHSAELRAMLLTTGDSGPIACGSWKVLVQCLVDLANRDHGTLGIKLQFEGRHIFAPARPDNMPAAGMPASLPPSLAQRPSLPPMPLGEQQHRKSSTSSATVKSPATKPQARTSTRASSYTSLSLSLQTSPFESITPHNVALAATVHQALHLRRLEKEIGASAAAAAAAAAAATGGTQPHDAFVPALRQWLGNQLASTTQQHNQQSVLGPSFAATVIDNAAKRALPRNVTKLGFPARIECQDGCLVIRSVRSQSPPGDSVVELVWPLADVVVTEETEHTDTGNSSVLRITDTVFPQLFFPARPANLGGIATTVRKRKDTMAASNGLGQKVGVRPHLRSMYLAPNYPLDISLRLKEGRAEMLQLLESHISISRKGLADIFIAHGLV